MSSKLAEILFKDYRKRVLALLLLNPDKRYHVREIARITGTIAGTLNKELARLADAGILTKVNIGNQVQYSADKQCPIYEELAGILRKTAGLVQVLANALVSLEEKIDVALVFGSMASDKATSARNQSQGLHTKGMEKADYKAGWFCERSYETTEVIYYRD